MMDESQFDEAKKPKKLIGVRHIQYLLLCTACFAAYSVRIAFSVGIIAMITSDPVEGVPSYPEWSNRRNIMLSSFFWGYIPLQVIAGQLAEGFGAKWFLGSTMLVGSLFSLLIPPFASAFGYGGVIFCRVIQGIAQGFLFPCIHTLLSKWTNSADRAKVGAFTYAGVPLGTFISMPITGLFSQSEYVGWPAAFYFFGAVGVVWAILWTVLGSNSPSEHKTISSEEKNYIEWGLIAEKSKKKLPTPWKSIFTSLPFWAILVCHCGENWGYWTLLTQIPQYMDSILNFDIAANGVLSALPYFVFWLFSCVMGQIADFITGKGLTNPTQSRKLFTSIAMFVPVIALLSITFLENDDRVATICLLVLSVAATAGIFCGYYINHIDLSPNHAGSLIGITTMISNVMSLLAPLSVDLIIYITDYEETDKQLWSIVFYVASVVYLVTGAFYVYGASAEVQPWNSPREDEPSTKRVSKNSQYSLKRT